MKSLKQQAIEMLAQAMVSDVVKLAKANYQAVPADGRSKRDRIESAVESAIDAYEPGRILMETSDAVVDKLYRLADAQMRKTT